MIYHNVLYYNILNYVCMYICMFIYIYIYVLSIIMYILYIYIYSIYIYTIAPGLAVEALVHKKRARPVATPGLRYKIPA